MDETLGIEKSHVTSVEEILRIESLGGGRGIVEIAHCDLWTSCENLSGFTSGELCSGTVEGDDLRGGVGYEFPSCVRVLVIVMRRWMASNAGRTFRCAIPLTKSRVGEFLTQLLDDFWRCGCGARGPATDCAEEIG